MKATLFLFALIIISACSFSAVLTVSNDPLTPAQYTDLQTAVNAASSGDSIYVSGSYNNYGNVNITKQLTLIGAGANPDKQNPLATNINQIVVNANGITIEGFTFIQSKPNIGGYSKNITISRNKFDDYAPINVGGDGWTIKNNIFLYNGQVQINYYKNCLIENNIFEAVGINPPSCIVSSNQPSVAINHNLFIGSGKNGIMAVHNTVYSAVISNNIFYDIANRVYPNPQYPSYCIFLNNISYINFATENGFVA